MFKVNNRRTRHHSGVFIVDPEYIWQVILVLFCWIWTFKDQVVYFIALI